MTLFAVYFLDKQGSLAVRQQYLGAHIAWLDQHKECILVGGSLRHQPGDAALGGLWIVDAESKAEIEELILTDPFWINGLRASVEILYWSKAFPERQSLI